MIKNKFITLINNKKDCCGCSACKNICSQNAITMKTDEYGYVYPEINYDKCIRCGQCKKICSYQNDVLLQDVRSAWVASSKDEKIIVNSASGGVFAVIAKKILEENGIVIGVSLEKIDGKLIPKHIKIDSVDYLRKMQGSKYIQSDMGNIYIEIKKELNKKKKVLFSGTPCQVAALKYFLGKNYENLYTIDIICHGVPSIKIFQDYILNLEQSLNMEIINFKFRDKSIGWGLCGKIKYKKKDKIMEKILPAGISSYYNLFLTSEIYRENCYSCKYAKRKRIGDITIGDYWGVREEHPEYFYNNNKFIEKKGISCLIVNSTQGEKLLDEVKEYLNLEKSTIEKIAKHNEQLNRPSKVGKNRNSILNMYKKNGYKSVETWYRKKLGVKWYLFFLWSKLPSKIKLVIKKYYSNI